MGKRKPIPKREQERRERQRRAQWEKDNPDAVFRMEQFRRDVEQWGIQRHMFS